MDATLGIHQAHVAILIERRVHIQIALDGLCNGLVLLAADVNLHTLPAANVCNRLQLAVELVVAAQEHIVENLSVEVGVYSTSVAVFFTLLCLLVIW